jgi:hypothetical protein
MSTKIGFTIERVEEIFQPIADAANKAQMEGYNIDEIIVATAYMLGSMIRQRGGLLYPDKPLRDALPPVVIGYENAEMAQTVDVRQPSEAAFREAVSQEDALMATLAALEDHTIMNNVNIGRDPEKSTTLHLIRRARAQARQTLPRETVSAAFTELIRQLRSHKLDYAIKLARVAAGSLNLKWKEQDGD